MEIFEKKNDFYNNNANLEEVYKEVKDELEEFEINKIQENPEDIIDIFSKKTDNYKKYNVDDYLVLPNADIIDFDFAKNIYDFLNEKTDVLMNFDYINKLIKNTNNTSLISLGMGITITKDFLIYISTPLFKQNSESCYERVDIIKPNNYYSYLCNTKINVRSSLIDLTNDPLYDINRIKKIQEHLNRYIIEYSSNRVR